MATVSRSVSVAEEAAREVIDILATTQSYVIFGSFAGRILCGAEWSPDVDVMTDGRRSHNLIAERLVVAGFAATETRFDEQSLEVTLRRDELTVDLCWFPELAPPLFQSRIIAQVFQRDVYVVSPEAYFLLKLNHITRDLGGDRTHRDRAAINAIRPALRLPELRLLAGRLGARFWVRGLL